MQLEWCRQQDTHILLDVIEKKNFLHLQVAGMLKHFNNALMLAHTLMLKGGGETKIFLHAKLLAFLEG